jgi:hypothetical protein
MAIFRVGSTGPEVSRIQQRLQELGLYRGPIDGIFGGGTESSVVAYQKSAGLPADGKVGDQTWAALFASPGSGASAPAIATRPLAYRCLAFTGSIETGAPPPDCFAALTGDFDGQGISFGAIQFALGAGSLGEFLRELDRRVPTLLDDVFHQNAATLRAILRSPTDRQLAWASSIQHLPRHQLDEPWQGMFKALGRRPECQDLQVEFAGRRFDQAKALCQDYGLWSERAVALMFDIKVQNGSISGEVKALILQDFAGLGNLDRQTSEVEKMRAVARRRAAVCNPRWVEDVLNRKMTIANGQGAIHGRNYSLDADYGIRLVDFKA